MTPLMQRVFAQRRTREAEIAALRAEAEARGQPAVWDVAGPLMDAERCIARDRLYHYHIKRARAALAQGRGK